MNVAGDLEVWVAGTLLALEETGRGDETDPAVGDRAWHSPGRGGGRSAAGCHAMSSLALLAACTYFVVTLVWATLALDFWHLLRRRRPRHPIYRVLPVVTGVMAVEYALFTLFALTPDNVDGRLPGL